VTLLEFELNGRVYGGGVLKIEPVDAERIHIPFGGSGSTLTRIDRALRADNLPAASSTAGLALGMKPREIQVLMDSLASLRMSRLKLFRGPSAA
jgi:hypothetical protein